MGQKGAAPAFVVPVIPNIHQTILAAASPKGALDMSVWHSHTCETTHCRAGHVVHQAGPAGYELERRTSTLFAAMQIYKASSPLRVFPPRFFESDEEAMADIVRLADEEKALTQ